MLRPAVILMEFQEKSCQGNINLEALLQCYEGIFKCLYCDERKIFDV